MAPRADLLALALLSSLLIAKPAVAQLPGIGLSIGAEVAEPSGDFGKALSTGYGGYLGAHLDAVLIGAAARVEVIRFSGDAANTIFGARIGPRLGGGPLKFGFDIGRYSDIKRTGYTPNISLRLGPLEAEAGITFFSGGRWLSLSGGFGI